MTVAEAGLVPWAESGDDLGALEVAAVFVVLLDQHQAGLLAVSAGGRLQRDGRHAGDLRQHGGQIVDQAERALHGAFRLQRVDAGEAGQAGGRFVDLGIVLHGAGTKRIEAFVDGEVEVGQAREVAHHVHFRHLRQAGSFRAGHAAERVRRHGGDVEPGQRVTDAAGTAGFEQGFNRAEH